jgi:hypothetical protein
MQMNEILKAHGLTLFPMQACLESRHAGPSTFSNPGFAVNSAWQATGDEPILCELSLRALNFGNVARCIALVGRAITPDYDDAPDDDRLTLVYLLNPADPCVWEAVDSWVAAGLLWVRVSDRLQLATTTGALDHQILDSRAAEGEEFESDILGGELLQLMKDGQMEEALRSRLGVDDPIFFTIVETPMILKSLVPVDPELWRMHLEHQANKLRHEGIAS